jgi:Sec-independent protein translocase protein TatA
MNEEQKKALRAFQEAMGEVEPSKTSQTEEASDTKETKASGKKKHFWDKDK